MRVLITGGAGFIGTHVARRLLHEGYEVSILDNFNSQIHGENRNLALDLRGHVNLIAGDVRDKVIFAKALDEQEVVVHLAAETGTGQSMYEVERYTDVNLKGTAVLVDYLVNEKRSKIGKLVLGSSRAVYGEGKYYCRTDGIVYPPGRRADDMKVGRFNPRCQTCGSECEPLPTDEGSRTDPSSIYGLTKRMQEQMILLFAQTLGLSAFALRYQNIYGPGQSLSNPYTGILPAFANLARSNQSIQVFEDGQQGRDFVYIDDVVEATYRCIHSVSGIDILNVGSGERISIIQVAREISRFFDSTGDLLVTGIFREGDIRNSFADLTRVRLVLDFEPRWKFSDGIREFLSWVQTQEPIGASKYEKSFDEMRDRGLLHGDSAARR